MELDEYSIKVGKALGDQRLQATTARQRRLMDNALLRRLEKRGSVEKVTEDEIVGIYEIITEVVSPIELELIQGGPFDD
jgi:hypothetical protein